MLLALLLAMLLALLPSLLPALLSEVSPPSWAPLAAAAASGFCDPHISQYVMPEATKLSCWCKHNCTRPFSSLPTAVRS
jgi:hypothetical protein